MRTRFWLSLLLLCLAAGTTDALASPPTLPPLAVTVTVSPTTASVPLDGVRWITPTVTGAADNSLTWSVNGITGGNATVGTVTFQGQYTAPSTIPAGNNVTVTATSVADPTVSASAVITVRYPIPYITSVTPNPVALGPLNITVNGSRYINGAQVMLDGAALATTFVSSTQLKATGNAPQGGSRVVTVVNPGPGSVSYNYTLNVNSTFSVAVTPANPTVALNATKQFQATVTHPTNQAVTWRVNSVAGGNATVGTISATGLYTAPGALPNASTVSVSALSQADNATSGSTTVTLQNPPPPPTPTPTPIPVNLAAARLLDQATFGATPAEMAYLQQVGAAAYLDDQLAKPESVWPDPLAGGNVSEAIYAVFINSASGQDQLRQRVIYALSEIIVISRNKNTNGNELTPWLRILSRNAFGNYRTLLQEITLDASMGKYLDLVNSAKPSGSSAPNENYPREVMQLFSLGLYKLNPDGSQQLDANNQPIPTYTQTDVQQLARALTGWTFPTTPGQTPRCQNGSYWPGPMLPCQGNHDVTAKTILGQPLPANQTIQQDLQGALDIIFNHPNVGPFLATRLIRALVTSNPSPAYIARISSVFNDNGQGVRGDMKAVVRAILLDPEARNDAPPNNFGRLRSAYQQVIASMRALNATPPTQQNFIIGYLFDQQFDDGIINANSVFGHYSPTFRIPKGGGLYGPEFQIYTATSATYRANFIYTMLQGGQGFPVNLTPFTGIANNHAALINLLDAQLLQGRMTPATRTALLNMLNTQTDVNQKALGALYLVLTSGEFLVQR